MIIFIMVFFSFLVLYAKFQRQSIIPPYPKTISLIAKRGALFVIQKMKAYSFRIDAKNR